MEAQLTVAIRTELDKAGLKEGRILFPPALVHTQESVIWWTPNLIEYN